MQLGLIDSPIGDNATETSAFDSQTCYDEVKIREKWKYKSFTGIVIIKNIDITDLYIIIVMVYYIQLLLSE